MRRLLTPRFVALHLLVVVLVAVMVNLGVWQLSRLDEKRAANAIIEARADDNPVDIATLRGSGALDPAENEWRSVVISGSYDPARAVTVLNRSAEGIAGTHSVAPFRSDDGRWIWVNRGFVPLAESTPAAPTGSLTVVGHLKRSEKRGALGAVDSTDSSTVEFQRLDVPLLNKLLTADDGSVETMFLLLAKESPETSDTWPARIPLPPLDEGSHLSYAGQWFLFSAVAVGGWLVIVRRSIRQSRESTSDAAA
ncbi:MAG: SURF1 family protein [Ilumatobacteraceae bacterium]